MLWDLFKIKLKEQSSAYCKGFCQVKKVQKSEKNSDCSDTKHPPIHLRVFLESMDFFYLDETPKLWSTNKKSEVRNIKDWFEQIEKDINRGNNKDKIKTERSEYKEKNDNIG